MASTSKAIANALALRAEGVNLQIPFEVFQSLQSFLTGIRYETVVFSDTYGPPTGILFLALDMEEAEDLLFELQELEVGIKDFDVYERFYLPLLGAVRKVHQEQ